MKILGIDPGFATTGYGILRVVGSRVCPIAHGCIKTSPRETTSNRLLTLAQGVEELIEVHDPTVLAIEELFFNTNAKSAMLVGQARGVVLLTAAGKGLDIAEYTPLQVKQGVVGYGRANKTQVQEMVKVILNLETIPRPPDAADALAVAICHAHGFPLAKHLERARG